MADIVYIDKNIRENPVFEFKNLLDAGLATVQHMAGEHWTDYNVHDPGVTILEQLCYALTELGYRADFAFEDLLASQYNDKNTDDTYYTVARILPSGPITVNDLRKLLIDRIDGLRNVWIEPLNVSKARSQIRGVYMVYAEASPNSVNGEEAMQRLKKDIWDGLCKYGNLCEAFEKVILLERVKVFVGAQIELTYEADVDDVHAHVLFNLSRSMTRPLPFKKLDTLVEEGRHVNEIYEGPRLNNGFVDDGDLVKKINIINATTFVPSIKDVQGVAHVMTLNVHHNLPEDEIPASMVTDDTMFIDLNRIPILGNRVDDEVQPIKYYKHKTEIVPNLENVKKILERLVQTARVNYLYSHSPTDDFAIPAGIKTDIGSYYSMQNQFPVIYGLGPMGIPAALRGKKKAAILQLKGYLMLFDQIMANYFAQLGRFSDLFSLDKEVSQSYFGGIIGSLEDIRLMYTGISPELRDEEFYGQVQTVVDTALTAIDDFNDRRNRFLDHLLARFGERIATYGISRFNAYYSEKDYLKRMLDIKINLLFDLPKISKNRARSFNYGSDYWGTANTSPMERKIRILLDLPVTVSRIAAGNHELWRYLTYPRPFDFGTVFSHIHADRICPLDSEPVNLYATETDYPVNPHVIKKIRIDHETVNGVFKEGRLAIIKNSYYRVPHYLLLLRREIDTGTLDAQQKRLLNQIAYLFHDVKNEDKRYWLPGEEENYVIEFLENPQTGIYDELSPVAWRELASFHTMEEAVEAGKMLYAHIRKLNMDSEGFYLVDHVMLRPRTAVSTYGVHFADKALGVSFSSSTEFLFKDIQTSTIRLADRVKNATPLTKKTALGIALYMMDGKDELGFARQYFSSVWEALQHAEYGIKAFFNKFTGFDFYDADTVQIYKSYYREGVLGKDYSFRVTVVLPDWTIRFADPEFRQAVENAFRTECPAHIGIDFKWISFPDMVYFESIYSPWLEGLKNEHGETDRINDYSKKIIDFLKEDDAAKQERLKRHLSRQKQMTAE